MKFYKLFLLFSKNDLICRENVKKGKTKNDLHRMSQVGFCIGCFFMWMS